MTSGYPDNKKLPDNIGYFPDIRCILSINKKCIREDKIYVSKAVAIIKAYLVIKIR